MPSDVRSSIIDYARRLLIGPPLHEKDVPNGAPSEYYVAGTLYPQSRTFDVGHEFEWDEHSSGSASLDESGDDPVVQSNQWMPSALGLSFFLADGGSLDVSVWAGRYEKRGSEWHRRTIASEKDPETVRISVSGSSSSTVVLDSLALLRSVWRKMQGGYLVTVTLLNANEDEGNAIPDDEAVLFQAGFSCQPVSGRIGEYPSVDSLAGDPEEEELQLRYSHARVFAIGHGCSALWDTSASETASVDSVYTSALPSYEMRLTEVVRDHSLRINSFADTTIAEARIVESMRMFVQRYENWIDDLNEQLDEGRRTSFSSAIKRIERRHKNLVEGLYRGIDMLERDPLAMRAFRLANLAMLIQMVHAEQLGSGHPVSDFTEQPDQLPDKAWHPFQLAFLLLVIPSLVDSTNPDRDVVDLIWFPTGGGKTEAYLAVAAMEIFRRRLKEGSLGAGTTVISRYTLRLLTNEQFRRAATLICACEILRRKHRSDLGDSPISMGLWIGGSATPNTYKQACDVLQEMIDLKEEGNPFQLDRCPWCGAMLVPEGRDRVSEPIGVEVDNESFRFYCLNNQCSFKDKLPISVVDDHLYQEPPSFLMATVDKFAMLAWEDKAGAFFGSDVMPPSLIIQDELHLLSGPLGTTMGLYESAIETVIALRNNGVGPKVIASTATIRRADDQARSLFGKEVRVFPEPGVDSRHSYFASTSETQPGRLYVGLMSQSKRPTTTLIRIAAVLLQCINDVPMSQSNRDLYSTLVMYHNSLRELGMTVTFARDDIPARIRTIASSLDRRREIGDESVVELTGNRSASEIPDVLNRMGTGLGKRGHISQLICTNMLSVGIDVRRLNLMLVNGQPKAASEYIQATSRVGRNDPGLVFAHFSPTKPRDRSHFESFLPFHAAAYRYVEPSSATPFSAPSRERALPAALVILMRHGVPHLAGQEMAGDFDPSDATVRAAVDAFRKHMAKVDPREQASAVAHLERLIGDWADRAEALRCQERVKLVYKGLPNQGGHESLLRRFDGYGGEGWPTLVSMRNVDAECLLLVDGQV